MKPTYMSQATRQRAKQASERRAETNGLPLRTRLVLVELMRAQARRDELDAQTATARFAGRSL